MKRIIIINSHAEAINLIKFLVMWSLYDFILIQIFMKELF